MVSTLHRCSYDNSAISFVNKLKTIRRFSPFFSSFTFLFFPFLFNLFCFSSLCRRIDLLILLDTKVDPNCLLFSKRERKRESRRSPVVRGVVGCCDGARQTFSAEALIVDQGPTVFAVGASGVVWTFFLSSFFFSFFLFGRRPGPDMI